MSDTAFMRVVVLLTAVGIGYGITHIAVERLARRFSLAGGVEYVALGVVLGPVLGLLDAKLAHDIRPVLLLGAGALGMLAGLELGLRRRDAPRPAGASAAALAIASFTALLVIGLPLLLGYAFAADRAWTAVLVFAGIVALGSDGALVGTLARNLRAEGPVAALAEATANGVRTIATVGFGLAFAVIDNSALLAIRPAKGVAFALAVQLGAGVILGLLFGVVVHRKLDERTLLTVVVGMVLLAGGFAYAMDVSAIFVNFVAGLSFALTSPHATEALRTMRSIKQPFVIALYFFAGLEWMIGEPWVYAMIVPFVALRWLGRKLGGALAARLAGSSANLGPPTTAPGGLTLAFVLSIGLVYRETPGIVDIYGPLVTTLVVLELASVRAVRRWLVDAAGVTSDPLPRARG